VSEGPTIGGRRYYEPSDLGFERTIGERLRRLRGEGEPQE
jgi:putative ATPase